MIIHGYVAYNCIVAGIVQVYSISIVPVKGIVFESIIVGIMKVDSKAESLNIDSPDSNSGSFI
jgi:hypothetical protein